MFSLSSILPNILDNDDDDDDDDDDNSNDDDDDNGDGDDDIGHSAMYFISKHPCEHNWI